MQRQLGPLTLRLDSGALPLAVGDVLVLVLLLTGGVARHHPDKFGVVASDPLYVAVTLAPFLVGWLLVSPFGGAYSVGATETAKAAIPLAVRSWVGAEVVAIALRVVAFGESAAPVFVLVTLLTGAVGLAAWRFLFFKLR